MKTYARTSVHEFLGDLVVYRNLTPLDERLPRLDDVREQARVPPGVTPRKSQPAYGRVVVALLRAARKLDAHQPALERLVYVGDTRLNDGIAFDNIARAGGWAGRAFIASETPEPTAAEIVQSGSTVLYLAGHWGAVIDFERFCEAQGFPIDRQTAVVVDLDKTVLGARGRNDHVINQARVEAVRRAVSGLLGRSFDRQAFRMGYDTLNQAEFHPFTADNQDYLAYVCLILGSGLYRLQPLLHRVRTDQMTSFAHFIAEVDEQSGKLPASLRQIHQDIYTRVQTGDPTPFKAFRYHEYQATVERMGCLSDDLPVEDLLAREIVITQEVREAALRWKEQGALLFGLSDKPDEASIPMDQLADEGYLPIHRVETHAVGAR